MQGILTFASLGLGFALTLLLGPQWGIVMGLLAYLAGSNVLLNRDVNTLKAHHDRIVNELPELLRELTRGVEPAPVQKATSVKPEPTEALEQRLQALDHKLELLLRHVHTPAPQAPAPSPPPAQPVPAATANPEPMPVTATPSAKELELVRELLLKLAESMATREASGTAGTRQEPDPAPLAPTPPPAPTSKENEVAGRKLSINELRSELDKIAQELSIELGRPKA